MSKKLTFKQFSLLNSPVIYGIADSRTDYIVYIGKTTRPNKRVDHYQYPSLCHNDLLKQWIKDNYDNVVMVVLEENPENINHSERQWIRAYRDQLFNLVDGGEQVWREHVKYPWMAGRGIKCPSDLVMTRLRNRGEYKILINTVKDLRKRMSVKDRCVLEVGLAMDFYNMFGEKIERWLNTTEFKILSTLEA